MTGATIARNSVAFPNPSWRRGCTVSYGRISADGAREPVRVVITVGLVRVVTAVACLIRGFKVRKAIPSCATSGSPSYVGIRTDSPSPSSAHLNVRYREEHVKIERLERVRELFLCPPHLWGLLFVASTADRWATRDLCREPPHRLI